MRTIHGKTAAGTPGHVVRHAASTAVIIPLLAGLVLFVFGRSGTFQYVGYDDNLYIMRNPFIREGILSWATIKWAFTTLYAANWHPLTWLSHALDITLFGYPPGMHHLSSVFLHGLNAVLLFLLLRSLTGAPWKSALVAAIFAIHPLRTESVVWISERKDLLSSFFWLLNVGAYLRYVRRPSWRRYTPVFLFMGLGLMAKPMLVTLPFALLLFDYWPLGRAGLRDPIHPGLPWRSLLLEKAPLLGLSLASSVVTWIAQVKSEAVTVLEALPFSHRLTNACSAYAAYLWTFIFPFRLGVYYPHPGHALHLGRALLSLSILLAIGIFSWRRRDRPYLLAGWLWYLISLVPVIGLVQVGSQSRADRYTYLPLLGITIALVWGGAEIMARLGVRRLLRLLLAFAVVAGLTCAAVRQTSYWRDTETLFEHTLAVTRDNDIAHLVLAINYENRGLHERALRHLREAAHIAPGDPYIHYLLGSVLMQMNRVEEATSQYALAVEMTSGRTVKPFRIGGLLTLLDQEGGPGGTPAPPDPMAEALFSEALQADAKGDAVGAAEKFRQGLLREPDNPVAHYNLAGILVRLKKMDEAIFHYREALRLDPGLSAAENNLGAALASLGRNREAVQHFSRALSIDPANRYAEDNLRKLEGGSR